MGVTLSKAEAIVLCFLSAVISHTPSKNTQTTLSCVSAAGLADFDGLKLWEEGDHELRKREIEKELEKKGCAGGNKDKRESYILKRKRTT